VLWPRLALVVVLLGALAIRVYFAYTAYVFKDDDGTAALMSLHIMQGRETPLYFYGWFYVSALGAYVGALMYMIFGVSEVSLCLAMTLFSLLWVLATYLLFSRLVGRWGGVVAAALVAFAPFTAMWYSVKPLLGYPPTFAFGTLVVYLGVRLNERPMSARGEWACLLGLAALSGVAIWTNPLCTAYLVVALGLLAAYVVRARFRRALLAKLVVGLVVLVAALTPVILTAHEHGLAALFGFRSPRTALVGGSVALVRTFYIKDMIFNGSPVPEGGPARWLIGGLYAAAAVGLCAAFVAGVVAAAFGRGGRLRRAALVPVLFVVVYAALFLPSPMAGFKGPRYFVPFYLGVCAMFAWPFALRRRWVPIAAACAAFAVMAHNVVVVLGNPNGDAGRRRMAEMQSLVEKVKAAGLRHVMIDSLEGQPLTFVAREDVIFAQTYRERYYPYGVAAAGDDACGIIKDAAGIGVFEATLESLGVRAKGPILDAGVGVFYGFELPDDGLRLVEPLAVYVEPTEGASGEPGWLVDRNDETLLGGNYADGRALVVDFGRDVAIHGARFVAPHEREYPAGYVLWGLPDGADWRASSEWVELQRVERREALTCIYGNRLYHRIQFMPMECRFPTRRVRYLRIDGLQAPKPDALAWRLREAFFYECDEGAGRPDVDEAAEIARTLASSGVTLAVCDEWLSRKIEALDGPQPDVLPHYDPLYPRSHFDATVPLREGVAVVVERGHAEQCAALLAEASLDEVHVAVSAFPHYAALVIDDAPGAYSGFPGLRWNGFTLVETARIETAAWYHARGGVLEGRGRREDAMAYYRRAFAVFPGLPDNLAMLAPLDEDARRARAALTPEHETPCRFSSSLSLVGYTLEPETLTAGEPATLRLVWEIEGTVPYDHVPVFVHFLEGAGRGGREAILFQADHDAALPVTAGSTVPRARVLDEHTFTVPPDCLPGEVVMRLGALRCDDPRQRLRPRTKLPKRDRAVEVGRVEVAHSSGE
jgi:4-amino-4-deoxy-L-arabinose transferase-like glycosyltransferase